MRVNFSQKWAKERYGRRVRALLWRVVKLAFSFIPLRPYDIGGGGNYRHICIHGFYSNEWEKYSQKYDAIITLKLSKGVSDEEIVRLFAHELGI
jgi:hypothetical protein